MRRAFLAILLYLAAGAFAADLPPGPPLFVRVTVLEAPGVDGPFAATLTVTNLHRSPWYPGYSYKADGLALNAPSPWMEMKEIYPGEEVFTAMVSLAAAGKAVALPARMRVELARRGDAAVALGALEVSDPGGKLGLVLPERGVADADLQGRMAGIADIARRHLAAAAPWAVAPEDRPKQFIATASASLFGVYSDPAIAETELQALTSLGYNTMSDLSAQWADRFKVAYVGGADYRPPGIDDKPVAPEVLQKHYQDRAEAIKKDYGSLDRLRIFAMSDEPWWLFPDTSKALAADPAARKRFGEYLAGQGLTPKALGRKTWAEVAPVGPPDGNASIGERRLWYHTLRFANFEQIRGYAAATAALRRSFGDGVLAFTNWNNPGIWNSDLSKWGYPRYSFSHNWFDFSRAGGSTCLWLGPGNGEVGDGYRSTFRVWSLMLDLLRSAANEGVGKFGAYVHHNMIPDERGFEVELSIMDIAGKGGSGYNSYVWGPHYAFTEYMWSEKLGHYKYAADANRLIGRSERLMAGAKPPKADVALLWPYTSMIYDLNTLGYWTYNRDFMVEMEQLYFALAHRNIPVDFVDETLVQRGDLARYKVLYLAGPNLEAKTMDAVGRWVKAGGRLWASAPAGMKDEYDQPSAVIDALLGIRGRTVRKTAVDYSPKGGLRWLEPIGTVTPDPAAGLPPAALPAIGSRAAFALAGGQVAGRFENGAPAIVRHRVGRGETVYVAAMPGLAYSHGATEKMGQPTTDYPEAVRKFITWLPESLGVARPAITSLPYVEALRLDSPRGSAVTLLNWSGKPVEALTVTLPGVKAGATIRSARGVAVVTAPPANDESITVTLPLPEVCDVLLVE